MKIKANFWGVLFRVGFSLFLGWFTGFIFKRNFIDMHYSSKEEVACLVYLFFVIGLWICFVLCFRGIFKIIVNEDQSEIMFSFLFRKETLKVKEIEGYYFINRFWTQRSNIEALILKVKSGKLIHLTVYELSSLDDFNQLLISKDIPCLGQIYPSFYPFRITPK